MHLAHEARRSLPPDTKIYNINGPCNSQLVHSQFTILLSTQSQPVNPSLYHISISLLASGMCAWFSVSKIPCLSTRVFLWILSDKFLQWKTEEVQDDDDTGGHVLSSGTGISDHFPSTVL